MTKFLFFAENFEVSVETGIKYFPIDLVILRLTIHPRNFLHSKGVLLVYLHGNTFHRRSLSKLKNLFFLKVLFLWTFIQTRSRLDRASIFRDALLFHYE